MKIYLIGQAGVGKTIVGRMLSFLLCEPHLDLDLLIEWDQQESTEDIIKSNGVDFFRKIESLALLKTLKINKAIISTGGGIVEAESNREFLKSQRVCWLTVSQQTLCKRLSSDVDSSRFFKKFDQKRYNQREMFYQEVSGLKVDANDKSPFDIACEISFFLKESFDV